MLRTTKLLLPTALLSLTILGLATIYNGGRLNVQWGTHHHFQIEGVTPVNTEDELHSQ